MCTVKPVLSGHAVKKKKKLAFKTNYHLMQVKVLQNAPREHSAILLTFIKLPFVLRPLSCLFLTGRFRQVLLYCRIEVFLVAGVGVYIFCSIYLWITEVLNCLKKDILAEVVKLKVQLFKMTRHIL